MTRLFVAKETRPGETRVAATPETVARLVKHGLEVQVERGAGTAASQTDAAFEEAGATVVDGLPAEVDVVLRVAPPTPEEAAAMAKGTLLVSFLQGVQQPDTVRALVDAGVSAWAMELVPRTTKAQKMDALSSQANIGGYKAVLIGATELGKYFPLLMTAAGTVKPARVVIFGVGVAGLQAIATAKRLGAQVEATDIRLETKEQVESLGAKFISVEGKGGEEPSVYAKEASAEYQAAQRAAVEASVAAADVVITTAQVPGRKAPLLVPTSMVETMKPGAVVVDLAVEQGGNCELSEVGTVVVHNGVKIVGTPNLPATVPIHASELYARNVLQVLEHVLPKDEDGKRGALTLDLDDEITGGSIAVHAGEIRHQPTAEALQPGTPS